MEQGDCQLALMICACRPLCLCAWKQHLERQTRPFFPLFRQGNHASRSVNDSKGFSAAASSPNPVIKISQCHSMIPLLKSPSSTSNFTARHNTPDTTPPFCLIGSICIGHLLCILIDGFNQRIRGSAQTSISVRPLPFFRASDSLLGLIKGSKFRQKERGREREQRRKKGEKGRKAGCKVEAQSIENNKKLGWIFLPGSSENTSSVAK